MGELYDVADDMISSIQTIQDDMNALKESSEILVNIMHSNYLLVYEELKQLQRKVEELELENEQLRIKLLKKNL